MDFGKQIKQIRTQLNLTQEQMADQLCVSRQAVSNWENNKNLPDLELLITMSKTFSLTLDELILGGNTMNNMTEKLIKDGSENRRTKMNLILTIIGAVLMSVGAGFLILKGMTVEYIDADGILHENFFMIPIGFLFLFSGFITICVGGLKSLIEKLRHKR